MKTLKFTHEEKSYTVKGEWDKDTFTAQAWQGKKQASAPFSIQKEKIEKGTLADDEALEGVVMEAAKNDVVNGEDT
ncbi:MAG: hypothetical protein COA91_01330 [Robiginitomaculum sp.]|nr:MAG: hypothetical protein COA91_01330 [Robiginitomaculum sp.]